MIKYGKYQTLLLLNISKKIYTINRPDLTVKGVDQKTILEEFNVRFNLF